MLSRYKKKRLRKIARGYRQIKKNNQLDLVANLVNVLSKTKLTNVRLSRSIISGRASFDGELAARQYLVTRLLSPAFNKAVLYSVGANRPLKHPLPKEWRTALSEQDVQVSDFVSSLLWVGYTFLLWGYGVSQGFKGIYSLLKTKSKPLGNYAYFNGLNANNIPSHSSDHNIINWYLKWRNKADNLDSLCHSASGVEDFRYQSVDIRYNEGLPHIHGVKIFYYIFWVILQSLYSGLFLLTDRYPAVLLGETIKLARFRLANTDQLARDYLFNNTGIFYRPIWTYEAEARQSRIILYFYGTNIEAFKKPTGDSIAGPYHLINWPYFLVWSKYQANFIFRLTQHDPIVEEVGVIWFSSTNTELPKIPRNSIALFDVQPFRDSFYVSAGAGVEYYVPNIANQFLSDIQKIAEQHNLTVLHKRKREHIYVHKRYIHQLRKLKNKNNYIEISPDIDAISIIRNSLLCISMPFTSTAHIANSEGRPSVYYDPSGLIQKNDRAAHGVPILTGVSELSEWVKSFDTQ